MFGRAAIRLGIGPHSSYFLIRQLTAVRVIVASFVLAVVASVCLVHSG